MITSFSLEESQIKFLEDIKYKKRIKNRSEVMRKLISYYKENPEQLENAIKE